MREGVNERQKIYKKTTYPNLNLMGGKDLISLNIFQNNRNGKVFYVVAQ